jgi:hypothetical protein
MRSGVNLNEIKRPAGRNFTAGFALAAGFSLALGAILAINCSC